MSDGYHRARSVDVASHLRAYLVADPAHSRTGDILADVDGALAGGVTMVQLRAKTLKDRAAFDMGRALRERCARAGVPFLVNDRVDLALAVQADGVHLGVDDMPLETARQVLGPDAIIGWSPDTDEQVTEAASRGADYLGVGPVYVTGSKADAGSAIGTDGLARRVALTPLPVVAIGGIATATASDCITSGAAGIAVISAILRANDVEHVTRVLRASVDAALSGR